RRVLRQSASPYFVARSPATLDVQSGRENRLSAAFFLDSATRIEPLMDGAKGQNGPHESTAFSEQNGVSHSTVHSSWSWFPRARQAPDPGPAGGLCLLLGGLDAVPGCPYHVMLRAGQGLTVPRYSQLCALWKITA